MIRTLPFLLGAILLSTQSFAQVTETFENGLPELSNNCWQFDNVKYTQKGGNPDYVLEGKGSIYSNPPVNNTNYRTLATPFLDVADAIAISFIYQLSAPLKNGATRIIEVGLEDKQGVFTFLDMITLTGSSSMAVQSYSGNKQITPGVYRLVIKMGGKLGDGNCRVVLDDLAIGANFHYAGHCNSAPTANDDSYTALKGNPYQGSSVLDNDQEPDGENMAAELVAGSPDGEVVLDADGSFSFTPNSLFNGETTSFTYRVTDDGYTPATSNTATVTIRFEEAAPPVHLIDFTGKMNKEKAQLHWEVGFNEMLDHFELEKSTDGNTFTTARLTKATGHSGVERYDATDASTAPKLMYRLKLVSSNGHVEYSPVITLGIKNENNQQAINIVQNPVISNLVVNYNSYTSETVLLSVTSNSGSPVYSGKYVANGGKNQYSVKAVSQLRAGTYIVTITNGKGERYSSLFVKM
ncbi:MAG TPA: Ig-like domain-containing protein [Flavisolibacter sp.]|nr:Ig-like domain-containing protein [Flavisolibacter sp.]